MKKYVKAHKSNVLLTRLCYYYLSRKSLLAIHKSFIRTHQAYDDTIYDQPQNDTLCRTIESVQYDAALAITGAIKGSSRERLYQELDCLESLINRHWYQKLVQFYKIITSILPEELHDLFP